MILTCDQYSHSKYRTLIVTVIISIFILGPFVAQAFGYQAQSAEKNTIPSMTALRIMDGADIQLDGRVIEDIWFRAVPARNFIQKEPIEGGEPSERTEVYVLYDKVNLYIGAILYDSNPDGILAFQKQRDASLGTDDRFMWILDTFLDGRTGYFFEINAAGLMGDGLIGAGGRFGINKAWDGIWKTWVSRRDDGWSAEIRIPFQTLNFNPNDDTWGINFQRTIRRKNEEILWSGHRRNQGLFAPIHAGRLTGLTGMSQGMGLEVKPYGVTGIQKTAESSTSYPGDAGFDLSYNVTTGLRAAITINTDFAEVEVDQRRVNLTRFSLRFPEQRDFFLEGSSVFSFAPRNGVEPYFSRRIGISDSTRSQIPVDFGARLGGQLGNTEIGFLQIRTGSGQSTASEDFTVARVKQKFLLQSTIGAIYTRRSTGTIDGSTAPPDRHTLGADLNLSTANFLGNQNLQFEAFLAWNSDPFRGGTSSFGDLSARGLRLNFPNDIWRVHVSFREFGKEYDPAVGFVPRNGFRRVQPTIVYAPRPQSIASIRQFEFELMHTRLMSLSNTLLTRQTKFKLLGIRFESQDNLNIEVEETFELLDGEFTISDGITIPVGEYSNVEWSLSGRMAGKRKVSGNFGLSRGGFWSGDRTRVSLELNYKPVPGVSLSAEGETNDITLPQGSFTTNIFRVEGGWHFSPWTSVTSNIQFDDRSDILGLFMKFRWIIRPGNDLFIVYTNNWESAGNRFRDFELALISRDFRTKLNFTHRF